MGHAASLPRNCGDHGFSILPSAFPLPWWGRCAAPSAPRSAAQSEFPNSGRAQHLTVRNLINPSRATTLASQGPPNVEYQGRLALHRTTTTATLNHGFHRWARPKSRQLRLLHSAFFLLPFPNPPPGTAATEARPRKETTLSAKTIAARVDLGTSKSANARLHNRMGKGKPLDTTRILQLGL